jgi:DNA-binding transcriptional LysR family regulator
MPRNLDLTALRSFVTVADAGGVTKAAALLNLTQSAVSMQLKRLEEGLGIGLIDRSGRGVALTPMGDQLLGYARRMLALNDEIYARLTAQEFEGKVTLGVPHDIVYPAIPKVLQRFAAEYPRVRVQLISSFTRDLRDRYDRGEVDLMLTTEAGCREGGETLTRLALQWVGAPGGQAWRQRPLRLAHEEPCIFRRPTQERLDAAGIPWTMAVDTVSARTSEATVSADLAVHTMLEGTEPPHFERIDHGGALPELGGLEVNLYVAADPADRGIGALAGMIRSAYRQIAAQVAAVAMSE